VIATLLWSLGLGWFIAIVWALSLFPQTLPFSETLRREAFGISVIWIVTGLLNRVADIGIARIAHAWSERESGSTEQRARAHLRGPTIARAASGFKTAVLLFLAVLTSLGEIGVPVGSVVTIGGIITIAVSLAAQNFLRDFINGFLVLFEDQYVLGDFVTINGLSGTVELLTLRVAQLRDTHGTLITIPHSTATNVMNHSRNWSRVDYLLSVDPSADAFRALDLLLTAIKEVAQDPQWSQAVLSPVEKSGIESITHDWTLLHATMRTAPLRQFDLRRAINAAVKRKFVEAGIGLGPTVPADVIPLA
jgi:small conductance mechanosensitive channel